MKIETVTVRQGELGRTFKLFENNREIHRPHARKLAKIMDEVSESGVLDLMRNGSGYYVIDGQHRVFAVSELMSTPVKFYAVVRDADDVEDITKLLIGRHQGKAWQSADSLFITRGGSPWVTVAEDVGFEASFKKTDRRGFSWTALLRARIVADAIHRIRGTAVSAAGASMQSLIKIWLEADPEIIQNTIAAVQWWAPVAQHWTLGPTVPASRALPARGLFGFLAMAIAIAIFETNNHSLLQTAQQRAMRDASLRFVATNVPLPSIALQIIRALNFRAQTQIVDLYLVTGRA